MTNRHWNGGVGNATWAGGVGNATWTGGVGNATGMALVRVMTALVLVPVVVVLIWVPALRVGFGVFVALFIFQGLREFYRLGRARGVTVESHAGVAVGTAVALSALGHSLGVTAAVVCAGAMALCCVAVLRGRLSLAGMATSVFGVVYVGWFGAHMTLLHQIPHTGPGLVTMAIAAVALSDTGAWVAGSLVGKHKLAVKVSPNKTWEGAAGGLVLAMIAMAVVYGLQTLFTWPGFPDWGLGRYVATGALLSVVGQLGDLTESAFKRDAGVKDAGSIFPGHGGMLDRCDGFLFAAPVLYYLVAPCGAV